MTAIVWSRPYVGVSHATVNRRQVTVTTHELGGIEAVVFPRPGTPDFWSSAETAWFLDVEAAKRWCEVLALGPPAGASR